jgi:hypothetical protein
MTGVTPFLERLRRLNQFHEDPRLIARTQTLQGQLVVWAVAALLLLPFEIAKVVIPAVALVMLLPAYRRLILSLGYLSVTSVPAASKRLLLGVFLYLCFLGTKHLKRLPGALRRRPQIWLHLFLWVVLVLLWKTAATEGLWRAGFLAIATGFLAMIWRCGYMPLLSLARVRWDRHTPGQRL